MTNIDTSTARVERVCEAFAVDLQHSCDVANAVDLLRALAGERDALKAELAGARNAALDEAHSAIMGVSVLDMYDAGHTIHYDDLQEFFADTVADLSTNKEA